MDDEEREDRRRWREQQAQTTPTTPEPETSMANTKRERIKTYLEGVLAKNPDVESEEAWENLPLELGGMALLSFENTYWYPLRKEILGDGPGEEPAESQQDQRSDPTPVPSPVPSATSWDPEPFGTPDDTPTRPVGEECRSEPEAEDRDTITRLDETPGPASETIQLDFGHGHLRAHRLDDGHWDVACDRVSDRLLRELVVEFFPRVSESVR